jgi:DNA-binding FrmR family transcriptional regulator
MTHQDREKVKLLQRVKKLRGQLDAVERTLSSTRTAAIS